jgi:uncharacterized protein YbaR (Trm112 family)
MMEQRKPAHGIDPKMLELLACPITKGPLAFSAETGELVSKAAGLAYPVRDGIPILLASEARPLEEPATGSKSAKLILNRPDASPKE